MKVFSNWFGQIRPTEPTRIVNRPPDPWMPSAPPHNDDRAELLVSPDRAEARLVNGYIADLFEDHLVRMYLPNRGRVKVFQSAQAWEIAHRVIADLDALSALVKPNQELFGSGATVHYPEGKDFAYVVAEGKAE